jgi:hypothetical protein
MARGGSLNEPTMVEAAAPRPAVKLPPARNPRADTPTSERAARKSGFVPFLIGVLVVTAVLAVIGWKAGPWLSQNTRSEPPAVVSQAKPQPAAAATAPPVVAPQNQEPVTAPVTPRDTTPAGTPVAQTKPSPMPPPEPAPAAEPEEPARRPVKTATSRPVAVAQSVTVSSSPSGATATLDGRPDAVCTTPCSLDAAPGRHAVSVTMPGYDVERREVEIGTGPVELPPVILRAPGGTLMLTTTPTGASISINGKKLPQTTPAQISLAPGSYTVTVEKDGKQVTKTVDVHNGISYLKLQLE